MSRHRHIIIAGSNKCGTTSLFRYFGHHPEVQISSVKESLFFRNNSCEEVEADYAAYLSLFPDLRSEKHVLVEATPQNLHLSLIHISEPTRRATISRMPSSA